jgi:hypothetical protein
MLLDSILNLLPMVGLDFLMTSYISSVVIMRSESPMALGSSLTGLASLTAMTVLTGRRHRYLPYRIVF